MSKLLSRLRLPLLIGVGVAQTGLLLSGVFAARALGVDGRGYLATAMLVPTLAAYLAAASSDPLVATLVAQGAAPRATMKTAVRVVAPPVLICAAAAATIMHTLLGDAVVSATAAAAVVATAAIQLASGLFVGLRRDLLVAAVQSAGPVLYGTTALIAFLLGSTDFRVYAGLWAVTSLIAAGLASAVVLKLAPVEGKAPPPPREFRRRTYVGLFSSYSPLESLRGDQILVLVVLGNSALGLYSVALALSNATKLLGLVASWTVPATANLEPAARLRRIAAINGALLIVGLAFSASFPVLLPLLFGPQFAGASAAAFVLGVVGALFAVRKVLVESLRLLGWEGRATLIELIATAIFVGLGIYLARAGDILGVAGALTAAAMVTVVGGWWQFSRGNHRQQTPATKQTGEPAPVS